MTSKHPLLMSRIIGICPIREFVREGDASGQVQYQKLFWVYYPEARPLLATNVVLNPYNPSQQMSFDDLFIKRLFHSYVVLKKMFITTEISMLI